MSNNNYGKFLVQTVLLILFSITLSAQESSREKQRAAEHQAVQDYISRNAPEYMPDPNYIPSNGKPEIKKNMLLKPDQLADRKSYLMNGNKVNATVWNYGGIGPGYGGIREVGGIVWRNLSYVFQFSPLVGAEVENAETGNNIHIISDGLFDYPRSGLREWDPEQQDFLWQWQPLEGYADPDQDNIAHNPDVDTDGDGKPDSWPRDWYNETLGEYVWPGFLSQNAVNSEVEVFWAMDDRDNKEFPYYPFPNDSSRKGLGVQIDGRAFQWSNVLAENSIFFVYTITNVSDKPLDKVFFGIYGDPDIGGGGVFNLNKGFFIPPFADDGSVDDVPVYARSLVYFWNPEGQGERGLPTGYLGCKFLESPGSPSDGIDNDGDGMIDERQDDGIDNDGDWNPDGDDVGVDGVEGTDDEGEGDGVPTPGKKLADGSLNPLFPGEPNFELTDLDESDQIGLTSFNSWIWETDAVSNDESMWNRSKPGNFDEIQEEPDDLVFIFGSGYIDLQPGETKRISMALMLGEDLDDLLTTSETVQRIYNQNYRFFKPPFTPTLTAVPGDEKVTLYWDDVAEESIDPITGKDFQGYVIYRSTDPDFNDIQVVTDGKGSRYLSEPLKKTDGTEAKWDLATTVEPFTDLNNNNKWDSGEPFEDVNGDGRYSGEIEDPWQGYHPVPYQGRGIHYFLGNNTGLVHSFIDSNDVVNGQTYYYALVAYDRGDSEGIPPSETTKKITRNPITGEMQFDLNTVQVIPGPRAAGYIEPAIGSENITHVGRGNGEVDFTLLNDLASADEGEYKLFFSDTLSIEGKKTALKNYSVLKMSPVTETIKLFDTKFSQLSNENVSDDEYLSVVKSTDPPTLFNEGEDYEISYGRGSVRRIEGSSINSGESVEVTYRYYPVSQSLNFEGEDSNPTFDGIELTVSDYESVEIDEEETGWISGGTNLSYNIILSTIGRASQKLKYPGDFEVTFSDQEEYEARIPESGTTSTIPVSVNFKVEEVTNGIAEQIMPLLIEQNTQKDSSWDPGDLIIFFKPGSIGLQTDTLTWMLNIIRPGDADSTFVPDIPGTGDVLYIATQRPFTAQDTFYLKTEGPKVAQDLSEESLDNVYVVPNPYIGYSILEPTNKLPGQARGERRIYFENLPQQCTIRIFTMSGELVTTLYHESSMSNGREYWNLLNRDGFGVAYGVYVAHIDAPGIGEKLLKFAIIK